MYSRMIRVINYPYIYIYIYILYTPYKYASASYVLCIVTGKRAGHIHLCCVIYEVVILWYNHIKCAHYIVNFGPRLPGTR